MDFKIDYANSIKTDKITTEVEWSKPRNVLLLNHSRVFQLYRVHGQRAKENILPLKTLEYYLINSKEYFGRKSSVSFKVEDNRRLVEDTEISVNPSGVETRRVTRRITTAMAFDYDALHISIHNNVDNVEVERQFQQPSEGMPF